MLKITQDFGAPVKNTLARVARLEGEGPMAFFLHNLGTNKAVLRCEKEADGSQVDTQQDTDVAAEDTGYTGNASTLTFTGQTLNNTPIVPGTVEVKPTTGGNTVNATDVNGDGVLYTSDTDLDECGTIDYFTGALALSYPSGKDPNTGTISADYTYQDAYLGAKGKKMYEIRSTSTTDVILAKCVSDTADGTHVRCTGVAGE